MQNRLLVHKHLIIRAEAIKPPVDEKLLKEWFLEFVKAINMKLFMGPYVKYCEMKGNRGITAVAIIETSHIAMHIWDEVSPALMQFDVYSCGDLNVEDICRKIENDFEIRKMEFKFLNREAGLQEISKK
jgi:S-adenosylmethionine/arginine decarboxylase-like enzyme|tara:strand:- start:152 stop:538 length:387 start_codon:yes stop_codon:yes gene_type:complete